MSRNLTLSALKGFAILAIMLIHLFDWSNLIAGVSYPAWVREFLHLFVLFFVALSGTVIFIAYAPRPLEKSTKRLMIRGLQIIGIYYAYVLIKFFLFQSGLYPIQAEPYFMMFEQAGLWTWKDMLLMHSGSVPLGILVTIGVCVFVSPLFLFIAQQSTFPKLSILILALISFYFSFISPLNIPILYAQGFSFFAPLPWLTVFLFGFFLGMIGFEHQKEKLLLWLSVFSVASMYFFAASGKALYPTWYMYPLNWYYILVGFFIMVVLMYSIDSILKYQNNKYVGYGFNFLETAGNETMYLYIAHWIAIDTILWLNYTVLQTYEKSYYIWYAVGLVLLFFIWQKRSVIFRSQE